MEKKTLYRIPGKGLWNMDYSTDSWMVNRKWQRKHDPFLDFYTRSMFYFRIVRLREKKGSWLLRCLSKTVGRVT